MMDKPCEEFWILLLNRANKVIQKVQISEGGISGTIIDPKKVIKTCIDHLIIGDNGFYSYTDEGVL